MLTAARTGASERSKARVARARADEKERTGGESKRSFQEHQRRPHKVLRDFCEGGGLSLRARRAGGGAGYRDNFHLGHPLEERLVRDDCVPKRDSEIAHHLLTIAQTREQ
eukprot:1000618-Pleurochrysis_carterae.AAC.2